MLNIHLLTDTTFNGKNYIEIATTSPETMMGDVAVAVNPDDATL